MFPIALPYFADPEALPSRLPTKEEIESSKDVFRTHFDHTILVGVGPHFVVKYGHMVDSTEGQNMLFVRQNTSVPVPRVYAIYVDMSEGKTYIIMERVTGETLDSLWPILTDTERAVIAAKLRESMHQLRGLPSPGCFCSLGNRGLTNPFLWTETLRMGGPFETEDELNAALVEKYLLNTGLKGRANYYTRKFRRVFRDHAPTFSHGDFRQSNILVRKPESLDGRPLEDSDVVLVDWEYSGWYPSYWEYAMALYPITEWKDDWDLLILKVLDESLLEFCWMYSFLMAQV